MIEGSPGGGVGRVEWSDWRENDDGFLAGPIMRGTLMIKPPW